MNMRRTIAAAFGAALLGAGTGAVVGGQAHGFTGGVTSSQKATGGTTTGDVDGSSGTINVSATLKSASGSHQSLGRLGQDVNNKAHAGNVNAKNHGSAKSGSQKFRIG